MAHAQFQGVRGERDNGRRCRREGGYMGHTIVKFEGRGCSGRHEGPNTVTTTQKEKKEERGKNKKTTKKRKRSPEETKSKKTKFFFAFGITLPRSPSLPKRTLGLPFEPQTRPDSGFPAGV